MFTTHLFKVIIGFCGMILLGLITLVIFDGYKKDTIPTTTTRIETPVTDITVVEKQPTQSPKPVKKTQR